MNQCILYSDYCTACSWQFACMWNDVFVWKCVGCLPYVDSPFQRVSPVSRRMMSSEPKTSMRPPAELAGDQRRVSDGLQNFAGQGRASMFIRSPQNKRQGVSAEYFFDRPRWIRPSVEAVREQAGNCLLLESCRAKVSGLGVAWDHYCVYARPAVVSVAECISAS